MALPCNETFTKPLGSTVPIILEFGGRFPILSATLAAYGASKVEDYSLVGTSVHLIVSGGAGEVVVRASSKVETRIRTAIIEEES